jgi:hypothetical protein
VTVVADATIWDVRAVDAVVGGFPAAVAGADEGAVTVSAECVHSVAVIVDAAVADVYTDQAVSDPASVALAV